MKILNHNLKTNLLSKLRFFCSSPVQKKPIEVSPGNFTDVKVPAGISAAYFHPSFIDNNPASKISKFVEKLLASPNNEPKYCNIDMQEAFKSLIQSGNVMGRGVYGIVHKIDDKYVFKLNYSDKSYFDSVNFQTDNTFDKLTTWYGGTLVKIGPANILRNANPYNNAIPCGVPLDINNPKEIMEHYSKIYLPKMSSLPQSSYDELANDFKILNNIGESQNKDYVFDTVNPNNFLISEDKIKIVDDIDIRPGSKNGLNSMLRPFLCKYRINSHLPEFDANLAHMRKEIFKKSILACERAEVPIKISLSDVGVFKLASNLSGFKTDGITMQNAIIDFRTNIPDSNQRLAAIEKYLEKTP